MSEDLQNDHVETPSTPIEPAHHHPAPVESTDWVRSLAEAMRTIIVVVGLAYLLRIFVFQPYIVEGTSMAPHFATNDYLLVDKFSYRVSAPQRGDIIVFRYPNDPSTYYVKRIIGLPGERVSIQNGKVTIFNSDNPQGFVLDESSYLDASVKTTLPLTNNSDFTVSAGHYFVLGDNRAASSDSREWGLLPQENIVGKVAIKAYPLSSAEFVPRGTY